MQLLQQTRKSTQPVELKVKKPAKYIFVVMLHSGKYVVGQATNPSVRIAALNSGHSKSVKALTINRVIGIKEIDEGRNYLSVVKSFCDKFGEDNVVCA